MLKLSNITKIYGSGENAVAALKDLNLNFRKNEFVSILGPSGCGKTTLLNIIGGLDRYTDGDLVINDVSTKDFTDKDWDTYRNRSVGFVFQSYNLIPHQTVLENVALALTISGMTIKERTRRAKEALIKVGLESQIRKMPNQLSGGQMQRVAIARALVNDPDIILADEPTGALDSATSVQVLKLLKEVAKDRLVIMVTHNEVLAERYSTRIINLLDGEVTGDNMPCTYPAPAVKKHKGKARMSFLTSFKLSMQNLVSKRARTFLTSFAGSIGIIGIALVLSVSNGFSIFMANLQEMSMGDNPIVIYSSMLNSEALSFDKMNDFMNGKIKTEEGEENKEYSDIFETGIKGSHGGSWSSAGEAVSNMQHKNFFTQEYLDYLQQSITEDLSKRIVYNYGVSFNLFARAGLSLDGEVKKLEIPYYSIQEMMATMDMSKYQQYVESFAAMYTSINWERLLGESDYMEQNFDLLAGENFPQDYTQIALLVKDDNTVDSTVLSALGFTKEQIESGLSVEDFLGKTFKILPNELYYNGAVMAYGGLDVLTLSPKGNYQELYENDEEGVISLTVSSIIRQKSGTSVISYDTGILYTPMLTQKVIEISQSGQLAAQLFQADALIIMSGLTPKIVAVKDAANKAVFEGAVNEDWQTVEKRFGISDMPTSIVIYAKDFDSKTQILYALNAYNEGKEEKDQILFSDATGMLMSYMGVLIDGVSYTLITFAAISLVVNSIMIGIITYVSVVERTREIGVLRALGASKKEVGWVFIAETFIIGLAAGILGIGASYILSAVINLIMTAVAPALSHIAVLNPLHALALIAISFVLTVIAGIIPSRIASRKDPVVALRSE